jgi:hypothetical protein
MLGERGARHSCSPLGVSHGISGFAGFEPEGRHSGSVRVINEASKERIPPCGLAFRAMAGPHGSRNVGYGNGALRARNCMS